jgi:hypothetical protein
MTFFWDDLDESPTARVQRGESPTARCASTEDHQSPSPPLFREQEDGQAALLQLALDLRRLVMERGNLGANEIGKVLVP